MPRFMIATSLLFALLLSIQADDVTKAFIDGTGQRLGHSR